MKNGLIQCIYKINGERIFTRIPYAYRGNLPIMEPGLSHTDLGTSTPRQLAASFLAQSEEWRYFSNKGIWIHF